MDTMCMHKIKDLTITSMTGTDDGGYHRKIKIASRKGQTFEVWLFGDTKEDLKICEEI